MERAHRPTLPIPACRPTSSTSRQSLSPCLGGRARAPFRPYRFSTASTFSPSRTPWSIPVISILPAPILPGHWVQLVGDCGETGPVFAYNAGFERRVILDLATRFPDLADPLKAIAVRLVDLLPIARKRFYAPSQKGSWSIKHVLPAIAPDLKYADLQGVQNGGMAMTAFLEALDPVSSPQRREQITQQLNSYCELDTMAMVRIYDFFQGNGNPARNLTP